MLVIDKSQSFHPTTNSPQFWAINLKGILHF
jgi:hypothetical protein